MEIPRVSFQGSPSGPRTQSSNYDGAAMNSNLVQKLRQTKELKNNIVFRLLSALVGCRWLHACSFNTLQSGHSHEDIDEAFSALAGQHSFALKCLAQLMTALSCLRIIFGFHGFLQILRQRRCQRQPRLVHDQSQNQPQKRMQITNKMCGNCGHQTHRASEASFP